MDLASGFEKLSLALKSLAPLPYTCFKSWWISNTKFIWLSPSSLTSVMFGPARAVLGLGSRFLTALRAQCLVVFQNPRQSITNPGIHPHHLLKGNLLHL